MDPKDYEDVATDDHILMPDVPAAEDAEDLPAIAVHPLAVALRQLEILQNQVFLAGPTSSIQANSKDNSQQATGEDAGPYCRLACDVLSCAVSACELWRESLLRHHTASAMNSGSELSSTELSRLLSKLLASLHVLDSLKDSKQALRAALSGVTAQEGDEQQLLAAVQDFFNMPTACLVLLRDLLLEDATVIARTKQALLRLLPIQLEAADCGQGAGQEGERKRGTLKSKLGLSTSSSQSGGDGSGSSSDSTIATRSSARIALSLLVYLFCCVDSAEQEQMANQAQNADGATTSVTPPGAKANAAATHKLLRSCVATLRATPIVPGYGDVPVDLLRPLQGLAQLSLGPPWESLTGGNTLVQASALEERYCLTTLSVTAANDYGRLVEELLALKLQHESERRRAADEVRESSNGSGATTGTGQVSVAPVDAKNAGGPDASAASRPPSLSQAALSRAAGALAGRAMQLIQDWQTAVLQLDSFRTWQRRQRQEDELREAATDAPDQPSMKATLPRCAFTPADMPDVVRVISYMKGLHGIISENMIWMEPLLRVHCAAHLGQLVTSVVLPVANGILGAAQGTATANAMTDRGSQQQRHQLQPMGRFSCEDHDLSAPSSARGTGAGSVFASTNPASTAPAVGASVEITEAIADSTAGFALGLGRMWKGKTARHGRSISTASSLEAMAPEVRQAAAAVAAAPVVNLSTAGQADNAINGPSQRTTEDSADTGNLIASITADGIDWTTGRPIEFRTADPYARLRDWFANGSASATAPAPGGANLNGPLQSVPEGQTPRSEKSPAVAAVASLGRREMVVTPSAEAGSMVAANSPSVHRGSCGSALADHHWPDSSGARLPATTGTEGTEDGVECTVSSVSDCEELLAALESEEEACETRADMPDDAVQEDAGPEPPKELPEAVTPKAQQRQPWPAGDMLWPAPPVPSASWLAGNTTSPANPATTTVSAGGASQVTSRSPAGQPRITAPAALSTNPLYIYPSAAREAVAEQERATVAIWIASEGGAGAPVLTTLENCIATSTATGPEGPMSHELAMQPQFDPTLHHQQAAYGGVRIYCDDMSTNLQLDSSMQPQSCYGEDRGYSAEVHLASGQMDGVVQQQQGYDEINAYCDELHMSHVQLDAQNPGYGDVNASCDEMAAHVRFDAAAQQQQQQQGVKKMASSPFKRIKRLFGKRFTTGEKSSAPPGVGGAPGTFCFEDPSGAHGGPMDPALEAFYCGDFPATGAGFGALPAPYLEDPRDIASFELESSALFGANGAHFGAYGVGLSARNLPSLSGEYLPGLMAEAAARDGAVAVLSVGSSNGGPAPGGAGDNPQMHTAGEMDTNSAANRNKLRLASTGGGTLKGAAAFLEIAARAREEYSCQRLRFFAGEMQICLASAGFTPGLDGFQRALPTAGGQRGAARGSRKGAAASGARASLKWLVTSFKGRSNIRQRSGAGAGNTADQDLSWACDAAQSLGMDAQGTARLRNAAELMAEELESMVAQRRARGKSSKEGPSQMQLMALTSELRTFLASSLPSLEPLLAFRANLTAASDLSSLLVLDPSRTYGIVPGNGLGSDARGSVPWELANKGVLINSGTESAVAGGQEVPLAAGLTVLTLFKDAVEALQLQQAQAAATGYPEPPTAGRLQLLYRRQAKWCLTTFVQLSARKVWGTYKAQALRSRLGMVVAPGAPDIAASTMSFQGLFRPSREDTAPHQLLMLACSRPDLVLETELTITDQLSGAIDDLIRQSAMRSAELLLGSDLTSLVAVKQQIDVLSAAVSRLRRELPTVRPWNDVWLAALAARAASSPTCASISEAAAATAAAVTQGCGSSAAGLTVSADEIILTHACSVAALRTLSTWSYDMTAVRFRPTKHTKSIWEGLVGSAANAETASPLLFPDGADLVLASAAVDSTTTAAGGGKYIARTGDGSTAVFSRAHVQAMHGLLGLDGVGRWVAALRRHAVELLADAAPLLRRVHELYDSSLAGPRGPGLRDSGGASGYLQLQQRWLRDRGHSELLVSAHRAMQALGNTVAAVALTDSVLAELCVGRAPHLLPLASSALQADQQAHAALKAVAIAEPPVGLVKPSAPVPVPAPPRGAGLAGLMLGQPLPPGLMSGVQSAVHAASLVQDRLQEQLPAAFGLPGMWRSLLECLQPPQSPRSEQLFTAARLWSVVQVQLSCLSPEEQVVHTTNVGDGVYVSAAALVQLEAGAAVAPGSVLHGDTMTALQQAVALEQLKAELAAVTAGQSSLLQAPHSVGAMEKATLEQLKAWLGRAEAVRSAWDRSVQLTVGAGTAAAKLAGQRTVRSDGASTSQPTVRGLDLPSLTSCSSDPWAALAQHAAQTGNAMLVRAAAAAASPPQQPPAAQQPVVAQSQGGALPGSRLHSALTHGRPSSQPGIALNQTMPPLSRNPPPRPPANAGPHQTAAQSNPSASAGLQRVSVNGPPLPPRGAASGMGSQYGRSMAGTTTDGPLLQQQPQHQQQQALHHLRAASQVLLRSPRGEGAALGSYGLFTIAGSTAAQSRSRAASSLGDWGHME